MLAEILKRHASTLKEANDAYKLNVTQINMQVCTILSSQLPDLKSPPPHWEEALAAYREARRGAKDWTNRVMVDLLVTPNDIVGSNDWIRETIEEAIKAAEYLVDHPNDDQARFYLVDHLHLLEDKFQWLVKGVKAALWDLQDFDNNLPHIAEDFSKISQLAVASSGADKARIEALKSDIKQLNQEIVNMIGLLIAAGFMFSMAVIVIVVNPFLFVSTALLVLLGAVTVDYAIKKIVDDDKRIKSDYSEMDKLTQDMATLSVIDSTFSDLANHTSELEDKLRPVLSEWQSLADNMSKALSEIKQAVTDADNPYFHSYAGVVSDLKDALDVWDEVYGKGATVELNIEVSDAPVSIGMSSAEIDAVLAKGTNTGVLTYINQVSELSAVA